VTRRLGLLRHAKSSYPAGVADHDRPLSARGRRDAPVAGQVLLDRLGTIDLVLVSSAARTQQTWALAEAAWRTPPRARTEQRIYEATPEQVLDVIREVPESVATLVLVGHVPGVSDLALDLTGTGDSDAVERMTTKFPTAALACLAVDVVWGNLRRGGGRLTSFDIARGVTQG
jgi:phosphohistidine phosphatase